MHSMADLLREFITLEEIAIVLMCSEDRVLVLIREGRIPAIKPGKAWVVPRAAFVSAVNDWAMKDAKIAQGPDEPAPLAQSELVYTPAKRGRGRPRTVMPPFESFSRG